MLVVGGGIGGLGTALALSRKGIPVHVIEQAPEFKEIGAGIQLGPNVFRMFEFLGLTEEMNKWAVFPQGLEMRDSITGETFIDLPVDHRFHEKYHAPYAVIHRADMLNVIYDACKKSNLITLTTSQKVVGVDQNAGRRHGAHRERPDLHGRRAGRLRRAVVHDPLRSSSATASRWCPATSPIARWCRPPDWPKEYRINKMILWGGEKTHLVHYPMRRGELFNLVVVFHSDRYEEGWDTYGDPEELHKKFADKCEPVRMLLKKVDAWKMWVLCDRPPIKEWTKGRITLLGDAAHPMLQYLAQGGNMALEDAVCLAEQVVAHGDDYAAAFKTYQELRYLRTARVQLMARVFGEIYHASGVNRELRNQVLGDWTAQGGVDMSWLYGHQPGPAARRDGRGAEAGT